MIPQRAAFVAVIVLVVGALSLFLGSGFDGVMRRLMVTPHKCTSGINPCSPWRARWGGNRWQVRQACFVIFINHINFTTTHWHFSPTGGPESLYSGTIAQIGVTDL